MEAVPSTPPTRLVLAHPPSPDHTVAKRCYPHFPRSPVTPLTSLSITTITPESLDFEEEEEVGAAGVFCNTLNRASGNVLNVVVIFYLLVSYMGIALEADNEQNKRLALLSFLLCVVMLKFQGQLEQHV